MKKAIKSLLIILLCSSSAYAQNYPEMISVEGGTFTMGYTPRDGENELELRKFQLPAHQVTLKSFEISKTPITVQQYRVFCEATGKSMPSTPRFGWKDDNPIVNVNWHDAVEYTKWLSVKTGKSYRLPTEAEWEFAARGGNGSRGTRFSGSDNLDLVGWYYGNSTTEELIVVDDKIDVINYKGTHPVAQKRANELGIFDMCGNVSEWCADWYSGNYYSVSPVSNPTGPKSGTERVLRGCAYGSSMFGCTVTVRYYANPNSKVDKYGFRVAL